MPVSGKAAMMSTSPPTVHDMHQALQSLAPDALAESWDNVGLLVGSRGQVVRRVMLALDPCPDLIQQAKALHCELVVTHHPAIFRPISRLIRDTPEGCFLIEAARANISVLACHTSLDSAEGGVSQTLAAGLGLTDIRPLAPAGRGFDEHCGLGAVGRFETPIGPEELVNRLRDCCRPPWLLCAGTAPQRITTVALCGGSGSDLAEAALAAGAEVHITAEIKHNVARWAEDAGIWLIDAGHFPTENPVMPRLAEGLRALCSARGWEVEVLRADQRTPLRLLWPKT